MTTHDQDLLFKVAKAIAAALNRPDEKFFEETKEDFLEVARVALEAAGYGPSGTTPACETMDRVADDLGRGKTFLCAPGEVHLDALPWTIELLDVNGRVVATVQANPSEGVEFPPLSYATTIFGARFTSSVVPLMPVEGKEPGS